MMKTDAGIKLIIENEKVLSKNEEQKTVKGARRSLHPLQKEAGDKENLVGAGRLKEMTPGKHKPSTKGLDSLPKRVFVKSDRADITVEDLTSEAGPTNAAYWEKLAEKRRVALEQALKENEELHQIVDYLKKENEQCKKIIEETQTVIETLSEMLQNPEEEFQEDDTE